MQDKARKYYTNEITERFLMAMDSILVDRKQGKVTLTAFGQKVHMAASNITRMRNSAGEKTVTVEAIARICEVYKISPYWLITGKGEMYTNAELFAAHETLDARVKDIEEALTGIEASLKTIKTAGHKKTNNLKKKMN